MVPPPLPLYFPAVLRHGGEHTITTPHTASDGVAEAVPHECDTDNDLETP